MGQTVKFEGTAPRLLSPPKISDTSCKELGSNYTVRLHTRPLPLLMPTASLEGPPNQPQMHQFTKDSWAPKVITATIYYKERTQTTVCQRERCTGQSLGRFCLWSFPPVLWSECMTLPVSLGDDMHWVSHQEGRLCWCMRTLLIGTLLSIDWLISHMVELSLQFDDTSWPKGPDLSHMVDLSGVASPNPKTIRCGSEIWCGHSLP